MEQLCMLVIAAMPEYSSCAYMNVIFKHLATYFPYSLFHI